MKRSAGVAKVVSGGQTGADRGALDAARASGVAIGGWIPRGRWAEDGPLPDGFDALRETASADPAERTERNVTDSDGTLIVSHGALSGGSAMTERLAEQLGKPILRVDLDFDTLERASERIAAWIGDHRIGVLNVAGPRASEDARIYADVSALVSAVLARS
jgi:Circularly permutated YpsA SLOG family